MANSNSSLEDTAYQRAIESFKQRCGLSQREIQDFEMTTLQDLQRAMSRIQNQQRESGTMLYLKRVEPFLQAVEQYGTIIENFTNTNDLLAYIWGPMKFLLNAASNFSEAFNALLEGYYKIGRTIPVLVEYRDILQSDPSLQEALVPIFEDILEFHSEAVKCLRQKTWKSAFRATWNHVNNKITQISKNLDQQKQFFNDQLSCSQYKDIHELRRDLRYGLGQLKDERDETNEAFERLKTEESTRQRKEVLQWLGAMNYDARHQDIIKHRHPGTGQWLFNNNKFQNWYKLNGCSDPLLWLSGQPGAGKTVLSSFVIEQLKQLHGVTTAFFYCKDGDSAKMRFLAIIKVLLAQLLAQNEGLLPAFYEKQARSGQETLSEIKLAKELLETALKDKKNTYVIIDGFDEYSRDDRKEIAAWFQQIVNSIPTHELGALRCLFVSQEDGYAKKDFPMLSHIKITAADNGEDIRLYAQLQQKEIEDKFGSLEGTMYNLADVITTRAQGMFLYARLVLWNLLQQSTKHELEHELDPKVLPTGFEEAYGRIIDRLLNPPSTVPDRRKNIIRLLGWLACAKRPLRWYEIQAAWSLDLEDGLFNTDLRFVEDSKDLCASLVEISSDGTVTLVHSTARAFLVQKNYIQPVEIEFEMADLCLTYLTLLDFVLDASNDRIAESILQGIHAFLDYAVSYWGSHIEAGFSKANTVESNHSADISSLLNNLDEFVDRYWIPNKPLDVVSVCDTLRKVLRPLEALRMCEEGLQCISVTKQALRPKGKNAPLDDMLSIYEVLQKSRNMLESMASLSAKANMKHLYGSTWFKCSRLNCRYFYQGFETDALRQHHRDRHELSYTCWVEGCLQSIKGCATAKELEKHMSEGHGILMGDEPDEFPPEEKNNVSEDARGKYQCTKCPMRYKSDKGLKNHLETTQCDQKTYFCEMCGSGFKRKQERKRHQDSHSSEKKYSCGGPLIDGGRWGCGNAYRRRDALNKHHRTEKGRVCKKPLLIEQRHLDRSR